MFFTFHALEDNSNWSSFGFLSLSNISDRDSQVLYLLVFLVFNIFWEFVNCRLAWLILPIFYMWCLKVCLCHTHLYNLSSLCHHVLPFSWYGYRLPRWVDVIKLYLPLYVVKFKIVSMFLHCTDWFLLAIVAFRNASCSMYFALQNRFCCSSAFNGFLNFICMHLPHFTTKIEYNILI